jgi:hypothetical protein
MIMQQFKLTGKLLVFLFLFHSTLWLSAQTETNVQALTEFAAEAEQEWNQMQQRAENYAVEHNIPLRRELEDGTIMQLVDVVDGQPVFFQTYNLGAAHTTRASHLWEGGSMGLNVSGDGYDKIGIWDGGRVRNTHQEFNNTGVARIILGDGAASFSSHATHVAGTIIAGGVSPEAKGMIHAGQLRTHDWNNHWNEIASAAAAGMEISNHSWGYTTGWNWNGSTWVWTGNSGVSPVEDYRFGFYGSNSRQMDLIAFNAPYHLIVVAAGNDRGDGPSNAGQPGVPEKDGGEDGFDCIDDFGTAKNTLAVGNIREILNYQDPSQAILYNSSSWGPSDDGRIKPDLVAKGTDTYSSASASNTAYETSTGTSMASPNAAGTLAQLQILYQEMNNGQPMLAATLKGLAIHTADEAGPHPGPDYMFGWGLLNAKAAAAVILDNAGQLAIDELVLASNDMYEREVEVLGGSPLKVTISWTDQPGIAQSPSLNPRTPHLRNDLDLVVMGPGGTPYYPWKKDYENPAEPATNDSKNSVDNVEVVFIPEAEAGTYTILVDHDGPLVGNQQAYSLIISGIDDYTEMAECSEGWDIVDFDPENVLLNQLLQWKPGNFAASYDVYFGTDGNGTQTPTNIMNGENVTKPYFRHHMEPSTTYYLKVVPRNNMGANADCDVIWEFTTMDAIDDYPFLTNVEDATLPKLPDYWQAWNYSPHWNLNWESTNLTAAVGSKSMVVMTTGGQSRTFNNWLVSPPIQVDAAREYLVSFSYRGFLPSSPERFSLYWGLKADTTDLVNKALEVQGINVNAWRSETALLVPEHDGYIFLGWLADNPSGIGLFLDEILIEDWGMVGVAESLEKQIRVQHRDGKLSIQSEFSLEGMELSVVNAAGQSLLQQQLPGVMQYETAIDLPTGVYVVKVSSEKLNKTVKFFIN